jgi:hypothetical protein
MQHIAGARGEQKSGGERGRDPRIEDSFGGHVVTMRDANNGGFGHLSFIV